LRCKTSGPTFTCAPHPLSREASIQIPKASGAGDAGRILVARVAAVLAIAALAPTYVLTTPTSNWEDPVLLVALAAIALVSLWGMVSIKPAVFLDAEFVAVMLAIAFLGPLPAALVWLSAESVYFVLVKRPALAHVSNIASYGWAVLAGALVLEALGPERITPESGAGAYAALAAAAVVTLCVNFIVARGIVGLTVDRHPLRTLVREELIRPAPATLLMIGVGLAIAFLYTHVEVLALALFTLAIVIPQNLLPILLKPRPAAELPFPEAVAIYASAIARELKLDRGLRPVLADAASFLHPSVFHPVQGKLTSADSPHWIEVQEALLFYREHWDAPGGTPGVLDGDLIPITSRVLAVAEVWARMTARGSQELSHPQAREVLRSRAGYHFDPAVVDAMVEIVAREEAGRSDRAYAPRRHRFPVPKPLTRLAALAGDRARALDLASSPSLALSKQTGGPGGL
jgi:hypothetical protein